MTELKNFKNTKNKSSAKIYKKKGLLVKKFKNYKAKNCSFSRSSIVLIFLLVGIGGTLLIHSFAHKIDDNSHKKILVHDQQIKMLQAWQNDVNEWIKKSRTKKMYRSDKFLDDFYLDSFVPFSNMGDVNKRIREKFSNFDQLFNNHFDGYRVSNHSPLSSRAYISQKEDDEFIYYQLNFRGFSKDGISVKIEDGLITFFSKRIEDSTSEDNNFKSRSKIESNFFYSFLVPKNIDLYNPEIIRERGKIIVKFKKNKD